MSEPKSTMVEPWTERGQKARTLLGSLPEKHWPRQAHRRFQAAPSESEARCWACGRIVSVELMCFGSGDLGCINCRLREDEA